MRQAVAAERAQLDRLAEPLDRAVAYGRLVAALQDEVVAATAERDASIIGLLASPAAPSNRALAKLLSISKARADILAKIARAGGRPRRR